MNSEQLLDIILGVIVLVLLVFAIYVPVAAFRMRERFSKEGAISVVVVSIMLILGSVAVIVLFGQHILARHTALPAQKVHQHLAGPHLSGGQLVDADQEYGLITIVRRERNRIRHKRAEERQVRRQIADLISQIPDADPAPQPSIIPAR